MLDEPYRWTEAISNRREYIEDQLSGGSPVVALIYEDGILILTVSRDQKKIYEVYDRIAYSAIGHPADVEKVRNLVIDMAHMEGFNRSASDVTLQRLVKFGLGPIIKQPFDEMFRSPYIIKVLMAELLNYGSGHSLYFLNYDGSFRSSTKFEVIAGSESAEKEMKSRLQTISNPEKLKLKEAVKLCLESWACGKRAIKVRTSDSDSDADQIDKNVQKRVNAELEEVLATELKEGEVEAAVLQKSKSGNSKFRTLTKSELGLK